MALNFYVVNLVIIFFQLLIYIRLNNYAFSNSDCEGRFEPFGTYQQFCLVLLTKQ